MVGGAICCSYRRRFDLKGRGVRLVYDNKTNLEYNYGSRLYRMRYEGLDERNMLRARAQNRV